MPTEHEVFMWLACCGFFSGALCGGVIGKKEGKSGCSAVVAAGVGGGGWITAAFGLVVGLFVRLYDVRGGPGLGNGFAYGALGFVIGSVSGIPGGFLGLLIGRLIGRLS